MSYEITGTLLTRSETETKGESFRVRTFGIKVSDGGQYENFASFQLTQDRCAIIDDLQKGDEIKVHFDLRGRQWQEKIFTNLNAWRVEKVSAASPDAVVASTTATPAATPEPVAEASSDLPF
jgi:single-strand DNA-binding protein